MCVCIYVCARGSLGQLSFATDRSRASRPITRRRSSDIGSPLWRIDENGVRQKEEEERRRLSVERPGVIVDRRLGVARRPLHDLESRVANRQSWLRR